MTLIIINNDNIIISYGNYILLSNIENLTQIKEFISNEGKGDIISITISSDKKYLIGSYSNKWISCWNISTGELLGSYLSYKKPTSIATVVLPGDNLREVLIVSDKGGELWAISLPNLNKKVKLFGHTGSVITDTIITKTNLCPYLTIVTADRDEKIRITEFPATYSIQKYLLNHHDVITTLSVCERELYSTSGYILSAGWDHKLNLWNKSTLTLSDSIQLSNHNNQLSSQTTTTITTPTSTSLVSNEHNINEVDNCNEENELPQIIDGDDINVNINENDDNDNENNENNENEENRAFDASKAGSFPMKVVSSSTFFPTSTNTFIAPIAIICWKMSEIKIYGIEEYQITNESLNSNTDAKIFQSNSNNQLQSHLTISLPAPPVDCCWINNLSNNTIQLFILLPIPYCIQIYTLQYNSNPIENEFPFQYQQVDNSTLAGLSILNDYIRNHECHTQQSLPFLELNAEHDGIRKHELDRPFDKMANIDKKIEKSKRRKYNKKN